jgi:hypothetical protein
MNWDKVWIVGNGPSRQTFDFEKLRHRNETETVIVLNKAIYEFPWAHVFFSLDYNFIFSNLNALRNFKGECHLVLKDSADAALLRGVHKIDSDLYLRSYANGFSDDPKTLCTGCNSGYCAVNLAYQKHAREIHLLGYDMNPNDPKETQYRFWAREFEYTLKQLAEKEIKVYNHNPNSFITAYPKVDVNAFNDASC